MAGMKAMNRPLALDLPLQGRQWIEASAGTGKTFTLSLLVLRLLLEREIALPNILAVTFTKAATQELKIKIRAQIKLAQDLLKEGLPDPLDGLEAGKRATAEFLRALLRQKSEQQLRRLLDMAIQDCDRASIFTIHGFCARVLNDHALSAGQVLQAPTLLTSTAALNTKIAFDLWREFSADRDLMRSLTSIWSGPDSLARQCDSLLQAENLLPELPALLPDEFDMLALNQRLRLAVETERDRAVALMAEAQQAGILHGAHMSRNIIETSFGKLENWYSLNSDQAREDPGFSRLSTSYVAAKVKKDFKKQTPVSPLFEAIELWYGGYAQVRAYEQTRDLQCLHLVRARLATRRETLLQKLQQYSYDDLIAQLVSALDGESGDELCDALRKEYPVALVDEFQDTDSQQWRIFSRLYPEHLAAQALYLIGDPKQAIYGFRGGDVHAYLAAKRESPSQWNLPENFRSRPGLLSAVATLFEQGGQNAFREQDIQFYPVHAGGAVLENDFLQNDAPAPAMHLALLPEYIDQKQKPSALPAGKARELATRACVEKIHELLSAGQQNKALIPDRDSKQMRGIQPGDIAVLVNQNKEAIQVQTMLAASGIASVVSSQENLFATFEAQELFVLLDALIEHQDQARWRGALSTVLLGYHADEIVGLESDAVAATRSADLAVQYRELWLHQGVLSLVTQIAAAAAPRILQFSDGERRLSNYLQLAETLQQASALNLGPEQCLRWLGQAMQEAGVDEENTLRLDSDQKRVRILTLHKSKGLEFPLVFMPFASFGKTQQSGAGLTLLNYHEHHRRITHALMHGDDDKNRIESIKARSAEEQLAEQVRLLYVGLTRAQYYCWVCCGSVYQADKSGFSSLLFRNEKDEIKLPSHAQFLSRLEAIHRQNGHIHVDLLSWQKQSLPRYQGEQTAQSLSFAKPANHMQLDWRILSFSQLTHGSSHQSPVVTAAADEMESENARLSAEEEIFDRRFSGIAFGNALHHALENTKVSAWTDHDNAGYAPESELPLLHQALLRQGYLQEELDAGVEQLAPLVFNTLRTPLPEGLRLCDLPEHQRLNEMEFHFSLRECDSQALLALLKKHGILQQREDFPFLRRMNGLMTGKIDLIYRHDGRFYVCDYKSNRLPAYDAAQCLQAMRDSEYDFQALIYTLALHRWCKFRLRSNYDYEKQMGGVRYLFCRGLNAGSNNGEGIVALRFERSLIEQLETLLHPVQEQAA